MIFSSINTPKYTIIRNSLSNDPNACGYSIGVEICSENENVLTSNQRYQLVY